MNKSSRRANLPVSVLLLLLMVVLNACTTGQTHRGMVENLVSTATTRSDHQVLADHYKKEAEEASHKAEQMHKHIEGYESGKLKLVPRQTDIFIRHCKAMFKKYNEIAQENKALAKLHREMAESL